MVRDEGQKFVSFAVALQYDRFPFLQYDRVPFSPTGWHVLAVPFMNCVNVLQPHTPVRPHTPNPPHQNLPGQPFAGFCVAACEESLAAWGEKFAGRECKEPFTCRADDGCECPLGGCLECIVSAGPADNVKCTTCTPERYLVNDKCRKELTCHGSKVSLTVAPTSLVKLSCATLARGHLVDFSLWQLLALTVATIIWENSLMRLTVPVTARRRRRRTATFVSSRMAAGQMCESTLLDECYIDACCNLVNKTFTPRVLLVKYLCCSPLHAYSPTTLRSIKTCTVCKNSMYFDGQRSACVTAIECPEGTIPVGECARSRLTLTLIILESAVTHLDGNHHSHLVY